MMNRNIKMFNEFLEKKDLNNSVVRDKYNGIVYCSSLNDDKIYFLFYILDNSNSYLSNLDINSVGSIKEISFEIGDEYQRISNNEVPYSDTERMDLFSPDTKKSLISYGFKIDGDINFNDLVKVKDNLNRLNKTFTIIKLDQVNI